MPLPVRPRLRAGELAKVEAITGSLANRTVNIGEPSEDRYVIFVAVGASGGAIAAWAAPTLNGTTMAQVVQDGATAGDDGQRGAIWILNVKQGTTAVLNASLGSFGGGFIMTLTGVRGAPNNFVTRVGSGALVTPAPGCALFYAVDNFGDITGITNMEKVGGINHIYADYRTTTDSTTYTITGSRNYLNRFVAWSFDY
jgi:hypothetical protein